MTQRIRARVLSAALVGVVAMGAALVPSGAAVALTPPPSASGSGTTGSVQLTPVLSAGETATPISLGLGRPSVIFQGFPPKNDGHSGTTGGGEGIVAQGQVEISGDTLLRVDVEAGSDSVQLRTELTYIEPRDLDPWHFATIEGPGTSDRYDLARPFDGLWLIDVYQVSGPAGVPVDVRTTTAKPEAPLTLSPATVSAANPTVTASWSGLAPNQTYLAGVLWAGASTSSVVEVTTGTGRPVATTTTARLSTPLQLPTNSTTLLTSVRAADGSAGPGVLSLKIDGVVRWSGTVVTGAPAVRLTVPKLPLGLHSVQTEFRPSAPSLTPSKSTALRLVSLAK
ncbi:hypothetical protein C1I63_10475 [Rathayibacter caricis DSM 15933]|jgi:hypothetical protein|uniref:Bacterial Ig-like domain-containing protein n=1 Tax=Rathayibacter caricis DSM 15933 TaxID=1328867 RepID=A0A2T4UUQ8_9MICO|nr:hypothetical protein [Rathayibacter caricis]MCJ1695201.1 hypothetical protein [Rathayibacter caricis]PTL73233.1 hypothetical protein C1I63_10475 [Rathayibacter caricis DSM 15933]